MSLKMAYNYGVAFSMFAFLNEYLKFIQLGIVLLDYNNISFKNKDIFEEYYFQYRCYMQVVYLIS